MFNRLGISLGKTSISFLFFIQLFLNVVGKLDLLNIIIAERNDPKNVYSPFLVSKARVVDFQDIGNIGYPSRIILKEQMERHLGTTHILVLSMYVKLMNRG